MTDDFVQNFVESCVPMGKRSLKQARIKIKITLTVVLPPTKKWTTVIKIKSFLIKRPIQ